MRRIQFYPSESLEKKLEADSKRLGVSVSTLVVDLLNEHYGLISKNTLSLSQITKKVLDEIKVYVNDSNSDREFDLLKASPTFKTINMVYEGKPSIIRARIGRSFAELVGSKTGPFPNVAPYKLNGKVKKNINNATIYTIENPGDNGSDE